MDRLADLQTNNRNNNHEESVYDPVWTDWLIYKQTIEIINMRNLSKIQYGPTG